jgi:hypothetical protein
MNTDLSPAEIAEIDKLILLKRQQVKWEAEDIICQEERERQILLRSDHTEGPWPEPERLVEHGQSSDADYVYVREGDKAHEVPAGHPFLIEVARRDGMIRYAWTGGGLTFDLDQYWKRRDPSWHFVMERLRGVAPNDWDRVIAQAIGELIDRRIPLGEYTLHYIKDRHVCPPDPKRRARDQERTLASVIGDQVKWLAGRLKDAGYTDATTRAEKYLAPRWREIIKQDCGRGRFSSGEALRVWLRWARKR